MRDNNRENLKQNRITVPRYILVQGTISIKSDRADNVEEEVLLRHITGEDDAKFEASNNEECSDIEDVELPPDVELNDERLSRDYL